MGLALASCDMAQTLATEQGSAVLQQRMNQVAHSSPVTCWPLSSLDLGLTLPLLQQGMRGLHTQLLEPTG